MFELKDVYASYGEGMVLRHVSLEAPKGRVTCLVGRNGAGKTTTLKSVMGLVKTPQGKILLDDKEIQDMKGPKRESAMSPRGGKSFPSLLWKKTFFSAWRRKRERAAYRILFMKPFPY